MEQQFGNGTAMSKWNDSQRVEKQLSLARRKSIKSPALVITKHQSFTLKDVHTNGTTLLTDT